MSETEHDNKPAAAQDPLSERSPPTSPEAQGQEEVQGQEKVVAVETVATQPEASPESLTDLQQTEAQQAEARTEVPADSHAEAHAELQAESRAESAPDAELETPMEAPPPAEAQPVQPPPVISAPPAKSSGGKGLLWFVVLLLIVATGGLGWLVWQQQTQLLGLQAGQDSTGSREAAVLARLQALEGLRESLEAQLQDQARTFEARVAQQGERLGTLQQDMLNVRLQRNTEVATPASVLLAEARGLLRLGRERVLAYQDIDTALGLYLAADEVLMVINDPGIQLIRQTLQRETDTLRGVRKPDIAGIHVQLGRLKVAVETLPLGDDESNTLAGFRSAGNAAAEEGGWINSLKAGLSRYFVISRQAEPVRPRISEEGVALLRLDIRLQLEQARLALMQGDTRLYQQAIDATAASISSWAESNAAAPLLASLEALRSAPLLPDLPPLGAALNALRTLSGEASTFEEQP